MVVIVFLTIYDYEAEKIKVSEMPLSDTNGIVTHG